MAIKPSIPKGTRDFGPAEVHRRQYILDTIREVFELYGFQPIETPAMEQMSTLTGKYGEEGDKLLFRILNSGDYLSKADAQTLQNKDSGGLAPSIAEKGLRYDLTIPFARFVVQHQNDITLPFRRYQMQPVWRADRPQKGRYREFWQCDADVIGSDSLVSEVELVEIYHRVFDELAIPVTIKINHREFLRVLGQFFNIENRLSEFLAVLDKIDKVGMTTVIQELGSKGFMQIEGGSPVDSGLQNIKDEAKNSINLRNAFQAVRSKLTALNQSVKPDHKDQMDEALYRNTILEQFYELLGWIEPLNKKENDEVVDRVVFDPFLARGLDYYTGTILEVTANNVEIGSIGGGGRYDNLTGVFGLPGISGVGISFGLDRIYDVLEAIDGFPEQVAHTTEAFVVRFEDAPIDKLMAITRDLRKAGIRTEIYPDVAKMKKQFKYADQNHVLWVITAGPEELDKGQVGLKNMTTGDQQTLKLTDAIEQIKADRNNA